MNKLPNSQLTNIPIEEIFSEDEKNTLEHDAFELRSDIQRVIESVMLSQHITLSELAKRLNKTLSVVSKQLDGNSNLTIKTIVEIMRALGDKLRISSQKFDVMVAEGKVAHPNVEYSYTKALEQFPNFVKSREACSRMETLYVIQQPQMMQLASIEQAGCGWGSPPIQAFLPFQQRPRNQ